MTTTAKKTTAKKPPAARPGMKRFAKPEPTPAAAPKPKPSAAAQPAEEPRRGRGRPKTFDDRQALILRFTPSEHRVIRQMAFDNHTTAQDLGREAFALLFKARGWRGLDIS